MGMIEDVQAQLDAAESAASQPNTDNPPPETPSPETPPGNTPPATTTSAEEPPAEAAAEEAVAEPAADAATKAADAARQSGWDRALQNNQQETKLLGKKIDSLLQQIQTQGGKATEAQVQQAEAMKDRLAELDTMLAGDFDSFEHAKPAIKTLADELRDTKKTLAAVHQKLDARERADQTREAQSQYASQVEAYWSGQPAGARQDFAAKAAELQGKGFTGERLQGALDAWWETYTPPATPPATVAADSTATTATNTPAAKKTAPSLPAGTTPGGARVVPANSGVRPPPKAKTPEEQMADGEVDFFGARFGPR